MYHKAIYEYGSSKKSYVRQYTFRKIEVFPKQDINKTINLFSDCFIRNINTTFDHQRRNTTTQHDKQYQNETGGGGKSKLSPKSSNSTPS